MIFQIFMQNQILKFEQVLKIRKARI